MEEKMKSNKGFTLIEIIIVLAVLAILTAIVVPSIGPSIERAKENSAKLSTRTLAIAVAEMRNIIILPPWPWWPPFDPPWPPIWPPQPPDIRVINVMQSEGNPPIIDTTVANAEFWSTNGSGFDSAYIDTFRNQLISNTPGDSAANAYPAAGRGKVWYGPYLFETGPDPWGNQYLCILNTGPGNFMGVLSAGADGIVSTGAIQPATNVVVGGDDILFRFE